MKYIKNLCLNSLILAAGIMVSNAENITFPAAAGVVNVKNAPYNAKGDGVTDDTAAIQQAIKDTIHTSSNLYIPNGTYIVSNSLLWKNNSNNWDTQLSMQGQSQAGTIIKLSNSASGFTNAASYKAVIVTASQNSNDAYGNGNQAFQNNIRNLTVDVGTGNLGAVGIDYITSNVGEIRDVTIKSTDSTKRGKAGIWLKRGECGPGYIRNVMIDGFDVGIESGLYQYGFTMEYITVKNQLVAGIRNVEHPVSLRKLTSVNTVPAVISTNNDGLMNLIDASCTGGISGNPAVIARGGMIVRNLTSSGYGNAIRNDNNSTTVAGPNVTEWFSHAPMTEFSPSGTGTLNLPVEDAPIYQNEDLNDWVVVDDSASDDTQSIRDAITSANSAGKKTICFKASGSYTISDTIVVSGGIRRIVGTQAGLRLGTALLSGDTRSIFRFENLTGTDIVFERFFFYLSQKDYNIQVTWLEQKTTTPLVIRDVGSFGGLTYKNTTSGGKLFIENCAASGFRFDNQEVWARQLNPEFHYAPYVLNSGANGRLWVLGLKTEGKGTLIITQTGAYTEVLGGCLLAIDNPNSPVVYPFIINEANAFLSFTNVNSNLFNQFVQETRGGVTQVHTPSENSGYPRAGWMQVGYCGYATAPASGSPIPGKIEAESYASMSGIQTEVTSDTGGGLNVGYVDAGDWMDYNVNVATAGTYNVEFRVASAISGQLQLQKSGTTLATINVPNTGGWQSWQTLTATGVSLTAGSQTLRVRASTAGWNLNWLNFTTGTSTTPTLDLTELETLADQNRSQTVPKVAAANLTTLGTLDWAIFGWNGTTPQIINGKSGATAISEPLIALGAGASDGGFGRMNWTYTNGTSPVSATSADTGGLGVRGNNSIDHSTTFQVNVAPNTTGSLYIWYGGLQGGHRLRTTMGSLVKDNTISVGYELFTIKKVRINYSSGSSTLINVNLSSYERYSWNPTAVIYGAALGN